MQGCETARDNGFKIELAKRAMVRALSTATSAVRRISK